MVGLGYLTDTVLSKLKMKSNKVSNHQILDFKAECKDILLTFCEKFLSKSPLQYPLTSYMSALNPRAMGQEPMLASTKFRKIMDILA